MHYRDVWKKANGNIPVDEKGRSYEIHHIDGNRKNNCLSNLLCLSIEEHYRLHLEQGDKAAAYRIAQRMKLDPLILKKLNREKSLGIKRPKEVCEKISKGLTGRVRTEEERLAVSKAKKGKPNGHLGLKHSDEWKQKQSSSNKHKCQHVETGEIFDSVREAADKFGYAFQNMYRRFKRGEFRKVEK